MGRAAAAGTYPVLGWCCDNGRLRVMDIDENLGKHLESIGDLANS